MNGFQIGRMQIDVRARLQAGNALISAAANETNLYTTLFRLFVTI